MWSFGRALILVNRPQSCSMLKGQLEMTSNYFLGKRLFCALKGDVNLAEDCFCRCSAPLGLTGTQHSLFIGILEPVCLSCYTIECIDFVTKLVKHAFHQSTKEQLRQCATEALSSGGEKRGLSETRSFTSFQTVGRTSQRGAGKVYSEDGVRDESQGRWEGHCCNLACWSGSCLPTR